MKRRSSRGIIFDGEEFLIFYRRRVDRIYYALPGGGIEEDETPSETVIRELKEEFCVDVEVLGYLGEKILDNSHEYFYRCSIIGGIPTLGGEELERFSKDNYYEIVKLNINELSGLDLFHNDMINRAYKKEYINE